MTTERKVEIITRLNELDKILNEINKERDELKKECKNENCYQEVWDHYFGDGKAHWGW